MKEQNYAEQNTYINKSIAIVAELVATLREDVDPTLVGRLKSLYTYVIERLAHANLLGDQQALDEAIKILTELRETWAQAEMILQEQTFGEAAA